MASDRRKFLALAALAPVAALSGVARGDNVLVCFDPATLGLSQKSRRRALGYADASTTPGKFCKLCSFYTETAPGCGTCQLLTGPVYASGLCNSFAAKAKA